MRFYSCPIPITTIDFTSSGEETDGYGGSTQEQNGINQPHLEVATRKPRKPRPITWASEYFGSECDSSSSFASTRVMETIPENLDWNRNRCHGDKGKLLTSSFKHVTGMCIGYAI